MKKSAFLIIFVCLTLLVSAVSAETGLLTLKARDLTTGRGTRNLAYESEDTRTYSLMDTQGNLLTSEAYTYMTNYIDTSLWRVKVASSDGVHVEGVIDDQGRVIVPPQYADITIWSDRWCTGVKLVPSSSDDKDYTYTNFSTDLKSFYRIDAVDFYHNGRLAGTLSRSEYGGMVSPHGDYICVTNQAGERIFYNKDMQRSPAQTSGSSEYNQVRLNGKYVYVHQGSGQYAFQEGCTLTEDEVEKAWLYDKGVVYGLQGQVLFKAAQNYDSIQNFNGDYAIVRMNSKKGVIDRSGKEIIPVEYEDLGNYSEKLFEYGYISAVKDGKFGFLDINGNVTCDFVYGKDAVRNRGVFATIKNLDGKYIVLSAAVGELPEHYTNVSMPSAGCMAFVAENENRQYALIDLYGNTVIPFSDYRSIDVNNAGTVALAYQGNRIYDIYTLDIQAPQKSDTVPEQEVIEAEEREAQDQGGSSTSLLDVFNFFKKTSETQNDDQEAPAPAAEDDGSWTCVNGHAGNTGNFCAECGSPRPAEEAANKCPNCGNEFEAGNAPRFCPNCGTKLHD